MANVVYSDSDGIISQMERRDAPDEVFAPPADEETYNKYRLQDDLRSPYRLPDDYVEGILPSTRRTPETPLIVFINARSGGRAGSDLANILSHALGRNQGAGPSSSTAAGADPLGGIDMQVQVLTTGSWPTQSNTVCNLPRELEVCCKEFSDYYLSTHSGRRLVWHTNMGTGDLKSSFGAKKHELTVTTYQMCILLLFNEVEKLSYREIHNATEIPPADLKRALQGLACVKGKSVLRKEPVSGWQC
eukprot:gene2800-12674_t